MGDAEGGAATHREAYARAEDLPRQPVQWGRRGGSAIGSDVLRASHGLEVAQGRVVGDHERLAVVDREGVRRAVVQVDDLEDPPPGGRGASGYPSRRLDHLDDHVRHVARRPDPGLGHPPEIEHEEREALAERRDEPGHAFRLALLVAVRADAGEEEGRVAVGSQHAPHPLGRHARELRERRRLVPPRPTCCGAHDQRVPPREVPQQGGERRRDQRPPPEPRAAGDGDRGGAPLRHLAAGHGCQPLAEQPREVLEHPGVREQKALEGRSVEREQAGAPRDGHGRRARPAVQQRHLAEHLSRAKPVDHAAVAAQDVELATQHDEQGVALLALAAHRVAALVGELDEESRQLLDLLAADDAEERNGRQGLHPLARRVRRGPLGLDPSARPITETWSGGGHCSAA